MASRLPKADREKTAKEIRDRVIQFQQDADWSSFTGKLQVYDIQWRKQLPRKNKPWPDA